MEGFTDVCVLMNRPMKNMRKTMIAKPTGSLQVAGGTGIGQLCINPQYMLNNKPITYNYRTINYYITARKCHIDPILDMEVDPAIAFMYAKQWDSYTGDVSVIDPFGPLCFNPASLVYYFYSKRLDGLWKNAEDTKDGYFEGYYDRFVGSGKDMEIIGRDKYPELYLFRLPILDCYLTEEHNQSVVTIGPLLSDEDIDKLESLCNNSTVQEFYKNSFGMNCPSIKKMKMLYDNAISKTTTLPSNLPENCIKRYNLPQHYYVDELKKI